MRFLKADKVFNGRELLPINTLLVTDENGKLKDFVQEQDIDSLKIERFEGTLTPGFVNAHCHLELSHLHNKIHQHTGLPSFAKQVIIQRNTVSKEEIAEHTKDANAKMWNKGIVAVGDISNNDESFLEKANSKIFYHTFIELIGLNPAGAEKIFDGGISLLQKLNTYNLKGSLSAHAAYSTSNKLIKKIADFDFAQDFSFSIHNQESDEETKMMVGEKSELEALFKFLNIDLSWFTAPGLSSLESYANVLSKNRSILVHNRVTIQNDLRRVLDKNVFWCFCPNANLYIENALPNFAIFKDQKHNICIGTDSLASNEQLDLVNEVNIILADNRVFTTQDLLRAITINGAEALGITDNYGQLQVGKNAGLNLVNIANSQIQFIKKIN